MLSGSFVNMAVSNGLVNGSSGPSLQLLKPVGGSFADAVCGCSLSSLRGVTSSSFFSPNQKPLLPSSHSAKESKFPNTFCMDEVCLLSGTIFTWTVLSAMSNFFVSIMTMVSYLEKDDYAYYLVLEELTLKLASGIAAMDVFPSSLEDGYREITCG